MAVRGIGGFLFRADDPAALRDWYATHLGVGAGEHGLWFPEAGPSVFSPVSPRSDAVPTGRGWMLNLRVDDLRSLCASLREAGIGVETDPVWDAPGVGRFARIQDPEGNPIELWEPDAADPGG